MAEDVIERLIQLATDPAADIPTPVDTGVMNPGPVRQVGLVPMAGQAPVLDFNAQSYRGGGVVKAPRPAYQGGGVVQAPSAGMAPQGAQGPIPIQTMEQDIQRLVKERPEEILKVKSAVMQLLQTGDLSLQELNTMEQLATAAVQNPELYPQIRQFAIQQGLGSEQEIPQQYDQGLAYAILLAARAAQSQVGGSGIPQAAGQPPQPVGQPPQPVGQPPQGSFLQGGPVSSRNADKTVPINAHDGEYVLKRGAVKALGLEKLNAMNDKYEDDGSSKQKA